MAIHPPPRRNFFFSVVSLLHFAAEYGIIIGPQDAAHNRISGRLAQLVEHLLDVQEVTGSSPVPSTKTKPEVTGPGFLFCTGIAETAPVRVLYCCAVEPGPADETGEAE